MTTPDPSTLLYSRKGRKWRIDVHRAEGVFDPFAFTVFFTGEVAKDFHRSRYMGLSLFKIFATCIEHTRRVLPTAVGELQPAEVPAYPRAISSTMAKGPEFRVDLALSRRHDGTLETMIAVYDADDDAAPMLVASNDEITDLCRDCVDVLAHFGVKVED